MTDAAVLEIVIDAMTIAAKLAAPVLIVSLVIGIVVSVLQAITQVQEMTLTFVPKLLGIALVVVGAGSWMLREFVSWVSALWSAIPSFV